MLLTRRTFALTFASLLATAVLAARILYTGQLTHLYLGWNLFLAWLPYLFAAFAWRQRIGPLLWLPGLLWLFFFPNALYIVTDLIHLRPGAVPLWYDATMLFIFAFLGVFLGLNSLRMMQVLVADRLGMWLGFLFALAGLVLGGIGVYIGRFLRWNSWDAFIRPSQLGLDLAATLLRPEQLPQLLGFVTLFCAVTAVTYLLLFFSEPVTPRHVAGKAP